MGPEALRAVAAAVVGEPGPDAMLRAVVEALAAQPDAALARIWLVGDGDRCSGCAMGSECPDRRRCLHLVASAGRPSASGEDWSRLDGAFRRIPLGAGKVGRVGAAGTGMLLHDMSARSTWIARPDWAAREGIRSFGAQPLAFRGEALGVLGVFSRSRIDSGAFGWLRAVADHAAAAVAGARALEAAERQRIRLERENAWLRRDAAPALAPHLLGASPAMTRLRDQIALVAPADTPVLVSGAPGTGRGLVAGRVHEASPRATRAFLRASVAATPPEAIEAELFGPAGRLEAADGGTLFLDEIAALPPGAQEGLLHLLRTRELGRPGDAQPRRADVRIVAATARDLAVEAAAGRFLRELYFRLSVAPLVVPALRDRPDDVAPLVEHLLPRIAARLDRPPPAVSAAQLRALERYEWPGNVRELVRVVELAVLRAAGGRARFELPPPDGREAGAEVIAAIDWRRRERANVEAALRRAGGRIYGRGGAAELLGVPPTTLVSRAKSLGIPRSTRQPDPKIAP